MAAHLWKLLRLKPPDGNLWAAYRHVFIETYVRDENGNEPLFTDWRGRRVKFGEGSFKHAFTRNPNFREGLDHTNELDRQRAERMLWIREVLAASAGSLQLYREQFQEGGKTKRRRLFYVIEEAYVVILNEPADADEPLQFVSAYPTTDRDYKNEIRRKNGALIDQRRGKPTETAAEEGNAPVLDGD
jgi:hypothetical protein